MHARRVPVSATAGSRVTAIRCACHGALFSLADGAALEGPALDPIAVVGRVGHGRRRVVADISTSALVCTRDPPPRRPAREALHRAAEIVVDGWRSFDQARAAAAADRRSASRSLLDGGAARGADRQRSRCSRTHGARSTQSIAQPRPRYFAFVGSSGLEIGVLGDLLASCFDVNLAVWAAAATEIEDQAIRWVAEFLGFPAGAGAFTSGGTVSNMTALAAARERALPGSRRTGLGRSRATLYCSEEAHYSIERAAELLGIGSEQRALAADRRRTGGSSRRRSTAAIRDDRAAGRTPIAVVATAGTTLTGAVDPIDGARRRLRPRPASGSTSTAPTGFPLRPPRPPGTCSPGSTGPTRSRSTRTSGSTCRRRAASCSFATVATT